MVRRRVPVVPRRQGPLRGGRAPPRVGGRRRGRVPPVRAAAPPARATRPPRRRARPASPPPARSSGSPSTGPRPSGDRPSTPTACWRGRSTPPAGARRRALKTRLMQAYFAEGVDVSDHGELARLAGEVGLDATAAADVLASDRYADVVRERRGRGRRAARHLRGPDLRASRRSLAVPGAQDPETFVSLLARVREPRIAHVIVGAATSSLHSEGAAPASDWGGWEAAGWVPPSGRRQRLRHPLRRRRRPPRRAPASARCGSRSSGRGSNRSGATAASTPTRSTATGGSCGRSGTPASQTWACLVHTTLPGLVQRGRARLPRRPHGPAGVAAARRPRRRGVRRSRRRLDHRPRARALRARRAGSTARCRRAATTATTPPSGCATSSPPTPRPPACCTCPAARPVATCRWLPTVDPLDDSVEARGGDAGRRRAAVAVVARARRADVVARRVVRATASPSPPTASFHPWPSRPGRGVGAWHRPSRRAPARGAPDRPLVVLTGAADDDDERRDGDPAPSLDTELAEPSRGAVEQVHWWSAVDGYEGWARLRRPQRPVRPRPQPDRDRGAVAQAVTRHGGASDEGDRADAQQPPRQDRLLEQRRRCRR